MELDTSICFKSFEFVIWNFVCHMLNFCMHALLVYFLDVIGGWSARYGYFVSSLMAYGVGVS